MFYYHMRKVNNFNQLTEKHEDLNLFKYLGFALLKNERLYFVRVYDMKIRTVCLASRLYADHSVFYSVRFQRYSHTVPCLKYFYNRPK